MTGLILKLGPHERVLINGVVIENGDRRSRLAVITPKANILRLRDALHPQHADTPVRRVCLSVQMVLSGDVAPQAAQKRLLQEIEQLSQVFRDADSRRLLTAASQAVLTSDHYQVLKNLRALLPREARLLAAAVS